MSEIATTAPTNQPRRPGQVEGRLTDQELANLITRERPYKVLDGSSLFVLVTPSGQRSWRWRYYIRGREKVLLLGSYPEVSLEAARAARDRARDKVQSALIRRMRRGRRSLRFLSRRNRPLKLLPVLGTPGGPQGDTRGMPRMS
jgi:hypothetical protein